VFVPRVQSLDLPKICFVYYPFSPYSRLCWSFNHHKIATKFLKQWLQLPRSALRVILYYPGVCSPSISLTVKHCKLSLLANVSQSSDLTLPELALQLDFGSGMLQLNDKHRLLLGLHPGQFLFILRASSDTLPTPVNLQRWKIQTSSSCQLCDCHRPTSAHSLSGCPTALQQGRYTYHHDQVLISLLLDIQKYCCDVTVVADFRLLPSL